MLSCDTRAISSRRKQITSGNDCFRANDLLKLLEGTVIPLFAIKNVYAKMLKPKIKDQKKIEVIEKFRAGQRISHKLL